MSTGKCQRKCDFSSHVLFSYVSVINEGNKKTNQGGQDINEKKTLLIYCNCRNYGYGLQGLEEFFFLKPLEVNVSFKVKD